MFETPSTDPITTGLEALMPLRPTDEEVESLRLPVEATRERANEAAARLHRLDAEITETKWRLGAKPELAQIVATIATQEVEARMQGLALPKGHSSKLQVAREAVLADEASHQDAQALLPALEAMRGRLQTEAHQAQSTADGRALVRKLLRDRCAAALQAVLDVEKEIARIDAELGAGGHFVGVEFRDPETGAR